MRYLWEVLLEAGREQIPEEKLRFIHTSGGSSYMEIALPCINQSWLGDTAGDGKLIEVNTYFRFYDIFKNMFSPDLTDYPALRESLTNLLLHMLAKNDVRKGMTKEDYHKRFLAQEITEGGFGEAASEVFGAMNREEQEILLSGWMNSFRVGSALPIFLDMINGLVKDSIVYHNNEFPDEIFIYTGLKRERSLKQRIRFLIDTFLDIRYRAEVFYEYHFGIIGVEETMQIDEIAIC